MVNVVDRVRGSLLAPDRIEDDHLWAAIDTMMRPGVASSDIYIQSRRFAALDVSGGRMTGSIVAGDRGLGLRATTASGDGFAFTQTLTPEALVDGAATAASIANDGDGQPAVRIGPRHAIEAGTAEATPLALNRRVAMLALIEAEARALDARIVSSKTSLTTDEEEVLLVSDTGLFFTDVRLFSRLTVEVGLQVGDRIYIGYAARGVVGDESIFQDKAVAMETARRALHNAEHRLRALPFAGGTMPVVLAAGWSGVLFHEAVGHGLEADIAGRGISPYSGRMGQTIASPACTIIDDGSIVGKAGTRTIDDEGMAGQQTVLVRDGILESYMHDRRTARAAGVAPTGNGRRQSYAHLPMPRMTNTYLAAGSSSAAEVIASVDRGVYCVDIGSGQVDLVSGQFVFGNVGEAYAIEGGKLTDPVADIRLMGSGPEVIAKIGMVADDLAFDNGIATCGKSAQELLVAVGQPTIRVDALAVGGNA